MSESCIWAPQNAERGNGLERQCGVANSHVLMGAPSFIHTHGPTYISTLWQHNNESKSRQSIRDKKEGSDALKYTVKLSNFESGY